MGGTRSISFSGFGAGFASKLADPKQSVACHMKAQQQYDDKYIYTNPTGKRKSAFASVNASDSCVYVIWRWVNCGRIDGCCALGW